MDAFLLGLSSGATCLASCAPFFMPVLAIESGSGRSHRSGIMGLFLAGRLVSYIAVGLLAGSLGALAAGFLAPAVDHALLRAGWALGGLVLLAGGLAGFENHAFCRHFAAREKPSFSAFALGIAAGFNICPPFIAAAGRAAALGTLGGAAYFALFFVGTSVWIVPFSLVPRAREKAAELRAVARIAMVLLGSYFLLILGLMGWS